LEPNEHLALSRLWSLTLYEVKILDPELFQLICLHKLILSRKTKMPGIAKRPADQIEMT